MERVNKLSDQLGRLRTAVEGAVLLSSWGDSLFWEADARTKPSGCKLSVSLDGNLPSCPATTVLCSFMRAWSAMMIAGMFSGFGSH